MKIVEKLRLGLLATPLPDRYRPVYNWFPMKEAFSRDLVRLVAETWGLGEGDLVLDPFCGTGTTPLACKELGLSGVGYDVHPVLLLAARVKLRDYDVTGVRQSVEALLKNDFERREIEAPGFVARVFPTPTLEDIAAVRGKIEEVADEATREFLQLGLAVAAMQSSWAHKDGAAIKVFKRPVPPLRKVLAQQLHKMCRDIEEFAPKPATVRVGRGDARKLVLGDESVTATITSPPYLGKQEYECIYRIEQWILSMEGPDTNELIGARPKTATENFSTVSEFIADKPMAAGAYFKDMQAAIKELHRVCKVGANVCLVVSDGCSQDGPVDVCIPLSEMAEKVGFKAKSIVVVNRRYCTTPSRKKIGTAREGLLFWEKRG